jgi:hypothetical protein
MLFGLRAFPHSAPLERNKHWQPEYRREMRDRSHSALSHPRAPIASPNKEQKFDWQALWQIERAGLISFSFSLYLAC